MKCKKCQGRGFIEYEHGLIQVSCIECFGTGDIEEAIAIEELKKDAIEELNDSISGTGPDNQLIRSADTSKSKQPSKRKAKKKAGKGTR